MAVVKVTKDNFESEVLNSDKTVLIDFWASWCGPCRMLSPIIDSLAEETDEVKICKVNVDEENDLAGSFGVMSIPTLIVIKDKKIINQSVGVQQKAAIKQMLGIK
ncbi:MAG TPA: thioredoxin [Candidatus Faecicola pullistercoris]|nr:thioredoxin [Candidatus Faecicola pullistercoris]